mgnify:CR=1 FL=1
MLFRSPVVRFFSRILNRVTITVVLVALQLLWLCWVAFAITTGTGRVWVNGLLNALSLLIVLYLVRKDENSAYKVGWIALIGILPLLGGALYLAFGNKRPAKRLRLKMQAVEDAHKKDLVQEPGVLEGLGKGMQSLLVSLSRYLVIIIPAAFLLSRVFGAKGGVDGFCRRRIRDGSLRVCGVPEGGVKKSR